MHLLTALLRRCGAPLAAVLGLVATAPASAGIGTNLNAVTDYSTQLPFIDLFKMARPWYTANASTFDTGEAARLDTDPQGWPRSLRPTGSGTASFDRVCTLVFSMGAVQGGPQDGRYPYAAGSYVLRYDGEGTLQYRLAGRKNEAQSAPGRDVIDVVPQEPGIQICITATDPRGVGQPLRNLRLYAPGDEARALAGEMFQPAFLARLRPYAALRFMDWMHTNSSTQQTPNQRPLPTDYSWATEGGVPAEVMVQLARTLQAAPWFTMPHGGNDDWVRTFAQVARDGLAADQPVYVEYSNEIWNNQFPQGGAIEDEGVARYAGRPGSDFDKRLNRYGERSAEVCALWREVFGSGASRVRCVIAGQAANSYIADTAMRCPLSARAPCSTGVHGIAIAPYLGDWVGLPQHQATVTAWGANFATGLPQLFTELEAGTGLNDAENGGGLPVVLGRIAAHAEVARTHNVQLLAYEGGQHLAGVGAPADVDAINQLFDAANRDARMGTLYTRYLQGWQQRGGGLFMHFSDVGSYSRFGRWGALEILPQTASPKHEALMGAALACLFGWAEVQFPAFFAPAGSATQALDPFIYRAYAGTGQALGYSSASGTVLTLGARTGAAPLDLGPVDALQRLAGCR